MNGIHEVVGSIPISSTILKKTDPSTNQVRLLDEFRFSVVFQGVRRLPQAAGFTLFTRFSGSPSYPASLAPQDSPHSHPYSPERF